MSFIVFDYQCQDCDLTYYDQMVRRSEVDDQWCPECKSKMMKLPAAPITTFKFGDRSAQKSKKSVSLRDPNPGAGKFSDTKDI